MKVEIWPDIADQWMSGSIGRRQRIVSRANSRKRRKLLDLVELLLPVGAADLDPVFLDQQRHEVAAIAFAVALDAADLVEKARQDAGVGVAHAGEGVGFVPRTLASISGWLASKRPFVHAVRRVVDVAVEERAVVGNT
jgi:hypothetical protein